MIAAEVAEVVLIPSDVAVTHEQETGLLSRLDSPATDFAGLSVRSPKSGRRLPHRDSHREQHSDRDSHTDLHRDFHVHGNTDFHPYVNANLYADTYLHTDKHVRAGEKNKWRQ